MRPAKVAVRVIALAAGSVGLLFLAALAFLVLRGGDSRAEERSDRIIPLTLTAESIDRFNIVGDRQDLFGSLEWVGGFVLNDRTDRLGGLSSLSVLDGGRRLISVSDDGTEFNAEILRDGDGRPVDVDKQALRQLRVLKQRMRYRSDMDTEGFDVAHQPGGDIAYVSFEASPRVAFAPIDADGWIGPLRKMVLPRAVEAIDGNAGFETVVAAPAGSALAGSLLAIAETDPDDSGLSPGWIFRQDRIDQRDAPSFSVVQSDGYSITDGAFMPNGNLVLLERRFGISIGIGMRMRMIEAADIRPGAKLEGRVLIEANLADEIDNMEGLSVWTDDAGATRLSVVSDDNHSFLQRMLYLEFKLVR